MCARRRQTVNPELQYMLRWLASKGLEISVDQFKRVAGKFERTDLPAGDQRAVDEILRVSWENYAEWKRVSRYAKKLKRR